MSAPHAPRVGDVIGHYRLEHVIGLGGMGQVFGARDLTLDRPVALKVVLGQFAESDDFTRRFQREAAVLASLDSPHVVSIFDHGEQDGVPYIVTQYVAGGDLGRLLRERGPMPPGLAVRVCSQIADALAAAHGVGVVHRDVKPANVLLRDDRTDRVHVYLCDFGVALTEGSGLTTPGAVAGTWNYLAPERTTGHHGSPASDLYSVGCLLWELITGRPPYAGSDVEVAMQHLSAPVPQLPGTDATTVRLNRVLGLTLAKLPEHRYAGAAQLRDELRALGQDLTGGGSTASGPALAAPSPRRRGRGRLVAGLLALVLVAAGGATAVALTAGDDPAPTTDPDPTPTSGAPSPDPGPVTTEPTPEPPDPVLGDLDGDGYGDLVLGDFDRTFVASSTGRRLGPLESTPVPQVKLVGDFDGDGGSELLRIEGETPTLALTTVLTDAPRKTTTMRTPRVSFEHTYDIDYLAADVDGDGADDVVVATPDGTGLVLTVALNRGDGTFARSTTWLTTRLGWERTDWAVADLDDDGRADLVHADPNEYGDFGDPGTATVLRSTGTAFRKLGSPLVVPKEFGDSYLSLDEFGAADVDGDGETELVGYSPYGFEAVIWRWNGREFRGATVWADGESEAGGGGLEGTLVDVDGDGLADVVTTGIEGLRVHLSTGTSFRYAPAWSTRKRTPEDAEIIDAVYLGIS